MCFEAHRTKNFLSASCLCLKGAGGRFLHQSVTFCSQSSLAPHSWGLLYQKMEVNIALLRSVCGPLVHLSRGGWGRDSYQHSLGITPQLSKHKNFPLSSEIGEKNSSNMWLLMNMSAAVVCPFNSFFPHSCQHFPERPLLVSTVKPISRSYVDSGGSHAIDNCRFPLDPYLLGRFLPLYAAVKLL